MTNSITVRKGENNILVMDGTGDNTKLWLCDPNQQAFFSYSVESQPTLTVIYQRKNKDWEFVSIGQAEPVLEWQPEVTNTQTVKLLNEMEKALFVWIEKGGYAAKA